MSNLAALPADGKGEVHPDPDLSWACYADKIVARIVAAIDSAPKCLSGRYAGYAVFRAEQLASLCGLTIHQLNRHLPKVKLLPFVKTQTWKRFPHPASTEVARRHLWFRLDPAKVPITPADPDWKARKRSAPWRKAKPVKKPKADHKAKRQANAVLRACIAKANASWEHGKWHKTKKSPTKRRAILNWVSGVRTDQEKGKFPEAGRGLAFLTSLIGIETVRRVLEPYDLALLSWTIYYCPLADCIEGELDWSKAVVPPLPKWWPWLSLTGRLAFLFVTQVEALKQAGYRIKEAA